MKVFCVTYGSGHVAMIAPIAKRLRMQGHDVIILGLTTAEAYLQAQGIDSIGFRHLLEPTDQEALAWGVRLTENMDQSSLIHPDETIAYLGLSYLDLIHREGPDQAARLYAEQGRHAFLPVSILRRALGRFHPDMVLATNSPRAERAAIIAAGQMGIPSVCVNDLFALQEYQWLGKPGYADKVCVLNEPVKSFLVERGRSPSEVEITGNPAFDRLSAPELVIQGASLRETRQWNDGKSTLLWASQPEPARHPFAPKKTGDPTLPRKIETILRQLVRQRDDLRLVVRYHPSENVCFVPEENVEFSPTGEDLGALLYAVDAVAVICSTVGLEAALIGKPVFSVEASVFSADAPYAEQGISIGCPSPQILPDLLCRWLDHQISTKPQINMAGDAAGKIVTIMDSLFHSKQSRPL